MEGDPVSALDRRGLERDDDDEFCTVGDCGDPTVAAETDEWFCPNGTALLNNAGGFEGCGDSNGFEPYMNPFAEADPNPKATATARRKRQAAIDAALGAIASKIYNGQGPPPLWPAEILITDMCSTTGINGGYMLNVTYEVLSELGTVMFGSELNGVSITESFASQTGNMGDLNNQAGTWSYANQELLPSGQFVDHLNSGGLPGFASQSGTALQMFTASGSFGSQPLGISVYGTSASGVNFNTYARTSVTVDGLGATHPCR